MDQGSDQDQKRLVADQAVVGPGPRGPHSACQFLHAVYLLLFSHECYMGTPV